MTRDDKVVEFPNPPPIPDEERAHRLKIEVERLAGLPTVEWLYYVATEDYLAKFGVDNATVKKMVEAVIKEREKARQAEQTEQRQLEARAEKQRAAARQRADKDTDKKARERTKEFTALAKLPKSEHAARLAALAKQLGEDPDALERAFAEFVAVEETIGPPDVESWPEPVNAKTWLDEVLVQLRRYIVIHDDAAAVICALSVPFAWVHDEVATYSPILAIQAADVEAAKTTLTLVLSLLTPRARVIVKPTGPSLYRLIDRHHPTLCVDNGDKLLARDRDLTDVVNASWTRGVRIPRTVDGNIHEFDPFCFKIINGVDLLPHLDPATRTRSIVVDLLPKLPDETVVNFKHAKADPQFAILWRQAKRWSDDNAVAVRDATPSLPDGFDGRLAENYALLFAIADIAGGDWPQRARAAAIKLARQYDVVSLGRQLLAVFYDLFSRYEGELTSKQVEAALPAYGDQWANYKNRGKPANKWDIAALLRPFGIAPTVIHPRGRAADRGYRDAQFEVAFRHYLRKRLPDRTPVRKQRKNPPK
jgi:putative DNA primase/helicase